MPTRDPVDADSLRLAASANSGCTFFLNFCILEIFGVVRKLFSELPKNYRTKLFSEFTVLLLFLIFKYLY